MRKIPDTVGCGENTEQREKDKKIPMASFGTRGLKTSLPSTGRLFRQKGNDDPFGTDFLPETLPADSPLLCSLHKIGDVTLGKADLLLCRRFPKADFLSAPSRRNKAFGVV